MLTAPTIPSFHMPALLGGFAVQLDFSPMALGIILALVAIFFATVTVILVYHWRRFPYDQAVFDSVERVYVIVSAVLLAVSILGILAS